MTERMSEAGASGLGAFVTESNRIEGITRPPTDYEIAAHAVFLATQDLRVETFENFVREVAARPLREHYGQDVFVAAHLPPPGGPQIRLDLEQIIADIYCEDKTPYESHVAYEKLHPFLDGNGRSGRVLWAWQMRRDGLDPFALPFLHRFYYQTLDASRG